MVPSGQAALRCGNTAVLTNIRRSHRGIYSLLPQQPLYHFLYFLLSKINISGSSAVAIGELLPRSTHLRDAFQLADTVKSRSFFCINNREPMAIIVLH